ncbi:hypothetical protein [Lebetimonas sp. JH292]|uniref:hypothetical protein n=1 Tax=Lebetimonas sp. JH292 TaxID=990068 RepID=UPI002101BBA8|nr:hypothetical protein [Lebetimonas sp. JH292]
MAVFLLLSIFICVYFLGKYFNLDKSVIDGILTGSLTNVPSLASALEVKNDPISLSVLYFCDNFFYKNASCYVQGGFG